VKSWIVFKAEKARLSRIELCPSFETFLDTESDLLSIPNRPKSCVSMKGKSYFQMKLFDLGFKHFNFIFFFDIILPQIKHNKCNLLWPNLKLVGTTPYKIVQMYHSKEYPLETTPLF